MSSYPEFRFTLIDFIELPLRLAQVCIVTVLMFTLHTLRNFFNKGGPIYDCTKDEYDHEFMPPGIDKNDVRDSRSPCPALNTLANHGYLPRNGRNIHPHQFINALQRGYGVTYPLASFLTWGTFYQMSQWTRMSLYDLARHNNVEHDASLAHRDARGTEEYAPTVVDREFLEELLRDSGDGVGLTETDVARARVRRENCYEKPLDKLHAGIACGEIALVLNLFHDVSIKNEISNNRLRTWWTTDKLPEGWKPTKKTGLLDMFLTMRRIKKEMAAICARPH